MKINSSRNEYHYRTETEGQNVIGHSGCGGRGVGRPVVINTEKKVVKPEKIRRGELDEEVELIERALDELVTNLKG